MKFQALGLPENLCRALEQNQITEPTAIQNGAIPAVLAGRDLISSARTGSGKTLAYALPVITRLLADNRAAALVLVPTREIGVQVQQVMQPYLRALDIPPATLIIGGVSFGPQIQNLRRRPPVIIATPGRLNDHLGSGKLRLDHVRALVLDEADRMLDMGFLPQVKQILRHLPQERQTLLFSATMPADLARACKDMLRDPERVAVDAPNTVNTDIEQRMQEVETNGKQDALLEAVSGEAIAAALVFTRTKRRTDRVAKFLDEYGVSAERIHGDRSQAQRQKAIEMFRAGKVKVLVATDIAARGLDIPQVDLVINLDLPEAKEDYVHRIGRTGRAGAKGVAISFVAPEERGHWASISGQKRGAGGEGESRGGRPSRSGRPFGRGPRPERAERTERKPRFERSARPEHSEESGSDERANRFDRPFRKENFGGEERAPHFERAGRPARAERAPRFPREDRAPRFEGRGGRGEATRYNGGEATRYNGGEERPARFGGGERGERPARPSRFQRWGAPRGEKNPNHIFTGREGDKQATGRDGGQSARGGYRGAPGGGRFSRDDRAPRGGQREGQGERKPRFGGHGHSAPPAEGQSRGRWRNRENRGQPSRW